MLPQVAYGTYTGTGSAITEATIGSLGFRPMLLMIINGTDGDVVNLKINGSTDATHISIGSAAAPVSSNGITFSDTGFAVGSDTTVTESGKVYRYFAIGGI